VVAVSKGFGVPVIQAALAAGVGIFGENRVQEAASKVEAAPDADWHLIGHLQSNKARPALRLFDTIHSVDSLELLDRIERIAHDDGRHPRVLLQVNPGGEAERAGFPLEWFSTQVDLPAGPLVQSLAGLRHAEPMGLMVMASLDAGPPAEQFATVRQLAERLRQASGLALPELSMGMTADAEDAVRQGSTLLRLGTAIFGPRPEHHR
jgi:pyridoxal phosphate enzyme (YggS family)